MSDEDSNSSSRSSESCRIRSKRLKSKYDEFFEITHASQMGMCKLCQHKKVEIKMKNRNTSGLRKHLLSFHEKESQIFLPVRKPTSSHSQSGDITRFLTTTAMSRQYVVLSVAIMGNYTPSGKAFVQQWTFYG
ncbi:unnamed protein product [Pieris macdunnoughi]|uniref:BED-type domain-containing protein n=1 Tax=Pieris macdunnoughi TaxID=345717 RepID=A0A821RPX1_9NEOP|nr:unnamed protein product [Pieris macdunnoughi]